MFEWVPDTSLLNYGPRVPLCPTCLMCLRADVRYVPAYRGAFASYVPSFLRTSSVIIFYVPYVPSFFTCLTCLPLTCLTCFLFLMCLMCLHFLRAYVPSFLHVLIAFILFTCFAFLVCLHIVRCVHFFYVTSVVKYALDVFIFNGLHFLTYLHFFTCLHYFVRAFAFLISLHIFYVPLILLSPLAFSRTLVVFIFTCPNLLHFLISNSK